VHVTAYASKSAANANKWMKAPGPLKIEGPPGLSLVSGQVPMGVPGVTGQVIELDRTGKLRFLP
jgi:hypothetical protein